MRPLSVSELLAVWERGWSARPFERALALLSAATPECSPATLAGVSLGRRDASLLQLREWVFGPDLALVATCPHCGQSLEMAVPAGSLRSSPSYRSDAAAGREIEVAAGDHEIRCRPPNSEDLLACVGLESAARRGRLFERCVLEARRQGQAVPAEQLPENVAELVVRRIAASDPQADVRIDLGCPDCRHQWTEVFDIVSFFWTEIDAWARRTLHDVHALASAYGWRESDVLALSPGRRQIYLTMAQA
ncbi:MAG: phage baseplate protein [Acidobacteria bacterium]|nr:MAG: phage baseplate protein [Acidobacteriota bacterium]